MGRGAGDGMGWDGMGREEKGRTCVFLEVGVGGLEEDLDSVERGDDRLGLRCTPHMSSLPPQRTTDGEKETHDAARDAARDPRANKVIEVSRGRGSSGLFWGCIGSHSNDAGSDSKQFMWGKVERARLFRFPACSVPFTCSPASRPSSLTHSLTHSLTRTMASKAKSDVKPLKGQEGAHTSPHHTSRTRVAHISRPRPSGRPRARIHQTSKPGPSSHETTPSLILSLR